MDICVGTRARCACHVTYAAGKVKTFATNDNALTSKSTVK